MIDVTRIIATDRIAAKTDRENIITEQHSRMFTQNLQNNLPKRGKRLCRFPLFEKIPNNHSLKNIIFGSVRYNCHYRTIGILKCYLLQIRSPLTTSDPPFSLHIC